MATIEFEAWPKIARLNRNCVVTEKLDGTNAAVVIVQHSLGGGEYPNPNRIAIIGLDSELDELGVFEHEYHVYAQSRTRFITPKDDNYGFAKWVEAHAEALVSILGSGRHYGEWWGAGIQRKYGLTGNDKRFSLFNTALWGHGFLESRSGQQVPGLGVVPVLYEGPFNQARINNEIEYMREHGSYAVPGFPRAEGVVVYHEALRSSFKITLEGDEAPKGAAGHALDVEGLKVAA